MSSKTNISTHSPFQPLECVLVGQGVSGNFFDWVDDPKVKHPLQQIVHETQEDLENIKRVCRDFGAEVFQAQPLEYDNALLDRQAIPVPPIQPRDVHLTLDDKVYCTSTNKIWNYIYEIVHEDNIVNLFNLTYTGQTQFTGGEMINGANCLKVGTRIILPHVIDGAMREFGINFFKEKGYEVIETNDPGHSDGCMSLLKPGVLISIMDVMNYDKTFKGWEVLSIKDQGWNQMRGWLEFKSKSKGRWWIEGEESNQYLTDFVDKWLKDWVGYVEETVFDVNMFSLSEDVVMVNNYNKEVFDFLKKHKIEPVICPIRHRYFWDGGLHCFTLDLKRKGIREDYFR